MNFSNIFLVPQHLDERSRFGAGKMAQRVKALVNDPGGLSSSLPLTWWKERTDSQPLSSDLRMLHKKPS